MAGAVTTDIKTYAARKAMIMSEENGLRHNGQINLIDFVAFRSNYGKPHSGECSYVSDGGHTAADGPPGMEQL